MMMMDSQIWRNLPDHLLEHILSFLPLSAFLSLRPTCKHFNSLLPSASASPPPPSSSFLLLSHPHFPHHSPLFNTPLNSWSPSPLPLPSPSLLSSSHGLLCFSSPSSSSFLVANLLSRSLRRLPFPSLPFSFDLPTLLPSPSPSPSSFKLFLLSSRHALVFDSASSSWLRFPRPDPAPVLTENHHQRGVPHAGALLFTTPDPTIVSFRLDTGEWDHSPAAIRLPAGLAFARLAGDGARKLYLVGGVGATGISRSMKLWELGDDDGGGGWVEVETMPEMVCRKFLSVCYHNYEHVYCFWHEGLICVCCYTWPEILYYKVSRRTWHWLPKCPSLPEKWSCGFRWFSFTPQLYASV